MMEVCRICLSTNIAKDISQLRIKQNDGGNPTEIFLFCLGILVSEDCRITTKLCKKCFKKILSFHEFKCLAQKNDAHIKAINSDAPKLGVGQSVVFLKESVNDYYNNNECNELDFKEEPLIKSENQDYVILGEDSTDYPSDCELLSVIKKIKYESVTESEIIAPVKLKREECQANEPIIKYETVETENVAPVKLKKKKDQKKSEICEECGKEVRNLKEHVLVHKPLQERKIIKCKECDKVFSSFGARYRHNKIKHLGIKDCCSICSKQVIDIKSHMLLAHKTEELPCLCLVCGRRFLRPSLLEDHMLTHTKDRPHECDACGKKFRNKLLLVTHIRRVHDKEKTHLCQFCSKSFFKQYHLQEHLRSHTKEKPHQCPECEKWFGSTTSLKSHRLIHSKVKKFECPYCDSTFAKPNYLRVHLVCHTKVKRHACKYCGLKFGRSDHRKRHEFTAHEKHVLPLPSL